VLRYCEEHGLAFISYKPLGVDMPPGTSIDPALQSAPRWEEGLAEVQARRGLGKPEAAIAWLVSRSPRILPIPSTSSMHHLESNIAAAAVRLSKEEMIAIG
jgi:aryl-alcohol dehydrogenase-like predicted oxidoreductase